MAKLKELFELYDKKIRRGKKFQYNNIEFKVIVSPYYIDLVVDKMYFLAEYDKETKQVSVFHLYDNEKDVCDIFEKYIDAYIPMNDKYNQKL